MKFISALIAIGFCLAPIIAPAQWKYEEKKDEMSGVAAKKATLNSTNKIALPFPYGAGVYGYMTVMPDEQKQPFSTDIFFGTSKGQVLSSEGAEVKFDDDPMISFGAVGIQGGSSHGLFLKFPGYIDGCDASATRGEDGPCRVTADQFVSRMIKASKMKVRVVYYDAGRVVFDYKPSGLKWAVQEVDPKPVPVAEPVKVVAPVVAAEQTARPVQSKLRLGVRYFDAQAKARLSPELLAKFPKSGLLIAAVEAGSPADRGGILPGDVIIRFAGVTIEQPDDMLVGLMTVAPGETVKAEVLRGGVPMTIQFVL